MLAYAAQPVIREAVCGMLESELSYERAEAERIMTEVWCTACPVCNVRRFYFLLLQFIRCRVPHVRCRSQVWRECEDEQVFGISKCTKSLFTQLKKLGIRIAVCTSDARSSTIVSLSKTDSIFNMRRVHSRSCPHRLSAPRCQNPTSLLTAILSAVEPRGFGRVKPRRRGCVRRRRVRTPEAGPAQRPLHLQQARLPPGYST